MALFFSGSRYSRELVISIPRGLPPEMEYAVMRQMGDDFIDICIRMLPFYPVASKKGRPPFSKSGVLLRSIGLSSGVTIACLSIWSAMGRHCMKGLTAHLLSLPSAGLTRACGIIWCLHLTPRATRMTPFQERFSIFDLFGWFVRGLAYLDRIF